MSEQDLSKLELLRKPFDDHQISKLPKPTKQQTDEVKNDYTKGIRCAICGGWHHPRVIHLDYVGHAALTDRLLDVDPQWNWEPLSVDDSGLPVYDDDGGLWIKLTILGITRLGYGDSEGKTGPAAKKEKIGDALRNAAMRFGAALDLWHKGDLHLDDTEPPPPRKKRVNKQLVQQYVQGFIDAIDAEDVLAMKQMGDELKDTPEHDAVWQALSTKQKTAIKEMLFTLKENKDE